MSRALWVTFVLALSGTAFSGVLSYREVFGPSAASCPSPGAPGTIFGYPACVYGFAMFAAIAVTSGMALYAGRGRGNRGALDVGNAVGAD